MAAFKTDAEIDAFWTQNEEARALLWVSPSTGQRRPTGSIPTCTDRDVQETVDNSSTPEGSLQSDADLLSGLLDKLGYFPEKTVLLPGGAGSRHGCTLFVNIRSNDAGSYERRSRTGPRERVLPGTLARVLQPTCRERRDSTVDTRRNQIPLPSPRMERV